MKRVLIHRHPACARCARIARVHHAFDWLDRVETTTATPASGPLEPGRIVIIDLTTGKRVRGAAGFALICRQIPAYRLLLPLLWIPAVRRAIAREIDPESTEDCHAAAGVAHHAS